MFANISKLGQSAAQHAAKLAESVSTATKNSRIQQEYDVGAFVTSAGPEGIWRIHKAKSRRDNRGVTSVSVWMLDKKTVHRGSSSTSKTNDLKPFVALLESDSRQLARLKHPGVVRLIEPLEESWSHYLMVTEEVACSLSDWSKGLKCPLPTEGDAQSILPTDLEVKEGLSTIADTLSFLHTTCTLAHCNLNPESVLVTVDGTWKLACFGLSQTYLPCANTDPWNLAPGQQGKSFSFDFGYPTHIQAVTRPTLAFTAPELVQGASTAAITGKVDIFSFACLAYYLLRRQPLLTATVTSEYRGLLKSLHLVPVEGLAPSLQGSMRAMLAEGPLDRPEAKDLWEIEFFKDDRLLRALRFINNILERDATQKHAFIKDLPNFWQQFDKRVLRLRVLPCLMQQWRDEAMRDVVLPIVLHMVQDLPPGTFQTLVMPELTEIMKGAQGEQLKKIIAAVPSLQAAMRPEQVERLIVPMLLRAAMQGDTRLQEQSLTALDSAVAKVGMECVHQAVLPGLLKCALKTQSAAVRVLALKSVAGLAGRLTDEGGKRVMNALTQLTNVDKSAPTLVVVLRVCEALGKSKSPEFAAAMLLPFLIPLLVASALQPEHVTNFMTVIRSLLARVEQWRLQGSRSSDPGAVGVPSRPTSAGLSWDDHTGGRGNQTGEAFMARPPSPSPAVGLGRSDSTDTTETWSSWTGNEAPQAPQAVAPSTGSGWSAAPKPAASAVGLSMHSNGLQASQRGVTAGMPPRPVQTTNGAGSGKGSSTVPAVLQGQTASPAKSGSGFPSGELRVGLLSQGSGSIDGSAGQDPFAALLLPSSTSSTTRTAAAGAHGGGGGGSVVQGQGWDPFA